MKGKITRLHRNTDAMARSLGKETKGEHNQSLKLSIYLSRRHLSEASKACDQAKAERKSRDADVAEFKMEEISRLIPNRTWNSSYFVQTFNENSVF